MHPLTAEEFRSILREALATSEQRTSVKIAAVEQRFIAEIAGVEQRFIAQIAAVEQRIIARQDRAVEAIATSIEEAEARAQGFARTIETNLLAAFHGHAKGQTARLHTAEVTMSDLAIRISALEERMLNVETRRPPQQPAA